MIRLKALMSAALIATLVAFGASAQSNDNDAEVAKKLLEGSKEIEGFLKIHKKEESVIAEISKGAMNKPFLLSISVARGVARGYVVAGLIRTESIYYWKLADKRLFLVAKNVRHMAKSGDPISRAVEEDFSDSIVATLNVKAERGGGVLVDLSELLFTDFSMIGNDLRSELGGGYSVDRRRTTWGSIKSFPENTEVEVDATYGGSGGQDLRTVPDGRGVSVTMHYSFSSIPSTGFKSRAADDRIGYFLTARKNYSQDGYDAPFVRYINRWNLEKANPRAALSPPKKPIVFYIEKSVPYEYRPTVREAVLEWNKAYEKAGFIDAIEVRFQEDDADWDAEDVRYNTIRWMTGEARYAIGPSRINPLTGEIYDADILVDSNWLRSFERQYEYFEKPVPDDDDARAASLTEYIQQIEGAHHVDAAHGGRDQYKCEFARGLAGQIALAAVAAEGAGGDGDAQENGMPKEFILQGLKELIMHEVGHTLGLRHNFKASSTIALEDLHNTQITSRDGLSGSVMDYSLINLAPQGVTQGHWFTTTLGSWDYLAIEYGYAAPSGDEKAKLKEIAERAAQPENAYATDGDVSAGVDPYANRRDASDDAVGFAKQRTQVMTDLRAQLIDKLVDEGEGYQQARSAFLTTISDMQSAQYFAARLVGGIDINRNHRGDEGEKPPLNFLSGTRQREALDYICSDVFSDAAYDFDPSIINKFGPERWDHWGSGSPARMDLGLYDRVLSGQLRALSQLFTTSTLDRVLESGLYAAEGEVPMTIGEIYEKVADAIWAELEQDGSGPWDASDPFISPIRRNLQRAHVKYILSGHALSSSSALPEDASSAAWLQLNELATRLDAALAKDGLDRDSRAHLFQTREFVRKAVEAAFTVSNY